jgi:hypothetical protein
MRYECNGGESAPHKIEWLKYSGRIFNDKIILIKNEVKATGKIPMDLIMINHQSKPRDQLFYL